MRPGGWWSVKMEELRKLIAFQRERKVCAIEKGRARFACSLG